MVKTSKKAGANAPEAVRVAPSRPRVDSGLRAGTGSQRVNTRLIVLYGAPKSRKTTACSTIKGAKWITPDSNCIPTLDAQGRLPPDEDIYEVSNLAEAKMLLEEMIVAASKGELVIPAGIIDSITQLSDWAQQDIARELGSTFLSAGGGKKDNGWQVFNASFGALLDAIAELSRYINVVCICHAKEKVDSARGDWAGLNLPPQMALKLGRIANWVIYQDIRSQFLGEEASVIEDEFTSVVPVSGGKLAITSALHTTTMGLWIAGCNGHSLRPEEPADLGALMKREGLL